jgi:hypothetical protein
MIELADGMGRGLDSDMKKTPGRAWGGSMCEATHSRMSRWPPGDRHRAISTAAAATSSRWWSTDMIESWVKEEAENKTDCEQQPFEGTCEARQPVKQGQRTSRERGRHNAGTTHQVNLAVPKRQLVRIARDV